MERALMDSLHRFYVDYGYQTYQLTCHPTVKRALSYVMSGSRTADDMSLFVTDMGPVSIVTDDHMSHDTFLLESTD